MKFKQWFSIALLGLSSSVMAQFCPLPDSLPTEKQQDQLFVTAMFEADYVFRGRLFTFFDDRCDGDICTWGSLVFKRLEDIEGFSHPYIEGDWIERCDQVWLHPTAWRSDKTKGAYKVNDQYLILANDTPNGIVFIGSRRGLKVKELMMKFELARISR